MATYRGVIVVDDWGEWSKRRKAFDEKLKRARLELIARLASISDFDAVSDLEKAQLLDEYKRVSPTFPACVLDRPETPDGSASDDPAHKIFWASDVVARTRARELEKGDEEGAVELLRLHSLSQRAIVPLVNDRNPDAADFFDELEDERRFSWRLQVLNGEVGIERWERKDGDWELCELDGNRSLADLVMLYATPGGLGFPFQLCPNCRRVFVVEKNQRYCSPNCYRDGTRDRRRKYQRELMRGRRAAHRKGA